MRAHPGPVRTATVNSPPSCPAGECRMALLASSAAISSMSSAQGESARMPRDLPSLPVWVHCQSGYRASVAASFLQAAGHAVTIVDDDFGRAAAVLPLTGDASLLRALSAA